MKWSIEAKKKRKLIAIKNKIRANQKKKLRIDLLKDNLYLVCFKIKNQIKKVKENKINIFNILIEYYSLKKNHLYYFYDFKRTNYE
jgi:hypothetical protein